MVIGAGSRDSVNQVMEEMLRLNNEQGNQMRTLMKERQIASRRLERDNDIYNELAQLNNQLSNMQREQLNKNRELEQLNRKLQELT
jgi:chromosome segregation ATPase